MYTEEELLMLSGISHFCYCKRRWSLIHIEKQWSENKFTAEGEILHKNADDPFFTQKRKDVIISRAMPVVSYKLGFYGICDVVEFEKADNDANAVKLPNRRGVWKINPVEYKHGDGKNEAVDCMQLCAQAICLEEMFNTKIELGYLYYAAKRQRKEILLTDKLKENVQEVANSMHKYFIEGKTISYEDDETKCRGCSLIEMCMPKIRLLNLREYKNNL